MEQSTKVVPKTSAKTIVTAIYLALLFYSGFKTFVRLDTEHLLTFEIKGFSIAFTTSMFLLYIVYANRKKFYYIAVPIIFAGFGYTFYTVYHSYSEMMQLELGFYLYIASFILFIVSLFFPMQESKNRSKKKSDIQKVISDMNLKEQMRDNFMVGTYLFGIKGKPELSNHLCAITTNKDSKDIVLVIASTETFQYEIKYEQIEKITVKSGWSVSSNGMYQVEDHSTERAMLATALLGVWGPMISESVGDLGNDEKMNYKISFTVEIHYKLDGESKRIVLEFHEDPDRFFEKFTGLYQKAS